MAERSVAESSGPLTRAASGLHLLATDPSNVYLWITSGTVRLVDTGLPGQEEAITESLRELGLHRGDVRRVVLTHWHADHSGSAAAVAAWGDVEVCVGRGDAAVVHGTPRWCAGTPRARRRCSLTPRGRCTSR